MNEKMRILLADDDTEFCARMSAVLDSADDFELVGIAENGEKALSAVNELRPDVLIIELMRGARRGSVPAQADGAAGGLRAASPVADRSAARGQGRGKHGA